MMTSQNMTARERARTALATVAVGAALLLAACGTTQALSGTSASGQASVIRDPDNPYWTGIHTSDGAVPGAKRTLVIRDPDNPYWSNPDAMPATPVSDPSAERLLRGLR